MYASSSLTPNEQRWERWETDRRILRERLPKVRHLVMIGTDMALAEGIVDVDSGAGRFEVVQIELLFSARYPDEPPRVWERGGRWAPASERHIQRGREFCLGLPGVDLPVTTLPEDFVHFLGQLLVFLHDQFIFDATKTWPGADWEHYEAGYVQFACETLDIRTAQEARELGPLIEGRLPRPHDRCPCGSRLAFARCHAGRVDRVRSVRELRIVPDLVERMVQRAHVA
jgi:SEC-C motif-containing protein